jgi:hypothetical protein
LQKSSGR